MLVYLVALRLVARIGHQATRKVQCVAIQICYHLYGSWIIIISLIHGHLHGCHLQLRIIHKGSSQTVDNLGGNHGLITLYVDDYIHIGIIKSHFGQSVGATGMIRRGHHGLATAGFHSLFHQLIIRSHNHLIGQLCLAGSFINSLNHGLATNQGQGLTRQAGRSITSRNYTKYLHFLSSSFLMALSIYSLNLSMPSVMRISIFRIYRGISRAE